MRIGPHAAVALGSHLRQLRDQPPVIIEKLLGLVTLHPVFEQLDMLFLGRHIGKRNLVGAPEIFCLLAIDFFRAGPSLRGSQNDHRPWGPLRRAVSSRALLNRLGLGNHGIQSLRHQLVYGLRVGAFDKIRLIAVADE